MIALVLLVQEASRQSRADLSKNKLYDFTVMESEENREDCTSEFVTTLTEGIVFRICCFVTRSH